MQEISVDILDAIQEKCERNNHYRVGIICADRERALQLRDALEYEWHATGIRCNIGYHDVRFNTNGSFVRILTYREVITGSARGNKFHELYLDTGMPLISPDTERVLNRMVVPYRRWDYHSAPYDLDNNPHVFQHIDIREFDYAYIERPVDFEITEDVLYKLKKIADSYTFDALSYIKQKEAPDLGEFAPSQELNSFLASLT
jgi:hypothetical protein